MRIVTKDGWVIEVLSTCGIVSIDTYSDTSQDSCEVHCAQLTNEQALIIAAALNKAVQDNINL